MSSGTKAILIVFAAIFLMAMFWLGQEIPMESQLEMYGDLRNTSAIIFGVMGAWLAILHPSSLKVVFSEDNKEINPKDKTTITLLLRPIFVATIVLVAALLIGPTVLAAKTIHQLLDIRETLRGLSFSLLCSLSVLQLWALLLTLVPADLIYLKIQKDEKNAQIKKRMFRTKKRTK